MLDNYECDNQLSLFDFIADNKPKNYKITKPVRLIEIFSGYGSQYMALKRLGIDVESYRTSEWCIPVVNLANAVHNNGEFEKTDYSKEEAVEILLKYGVSNDGKQPLTKENLQRKSVDWLNEVIGKFRATHNVGSVCNIHADSLGIVDCDKFTYLLTVFLVKIYLLLESKKDLAKKTKNMKKHLQEVVCYGKLNDYLMNVMNCHRFCLWKM